MRLLIYSANFAPEPTGIGKYSGEMAAWLAAQGHEVRVICAPPYYPAWKLDPAYGWPPYRRERWQGVEVFRAPLWVPQTPGGLKRLLHLVSFALSSLPVLLAQWRWRPQVVMVVAPALVCAPGGALLARMAGAAAWLHIQDFEVDVAFQMGLLKGARLRAWVSGMERWLYRRFDVVSSISRKMIERLREKQVPATAVRSLPNWVDVAHIQPLKTPSAYRAELGLPADAFVLLSSGTLGSKQGLNLIPEVARLLAAHRDIVFVVCGDGVMKPELERAAQKLPQLKLLPLQPFERLGELLGLADVHLLTQSVDAEDLVLPSKLTGMLASGRPVIATARADTEIASVVATCGRVVPPGDARALAAAILDLRADAELRGDLGAAARRFAEERLAMPAVLRQLEQDLASLTGSA
ncbi:MAG: colanic acid biosynthesis glycosyltransferase WcaI [Roseateles depolymerans]|uniref:Colanic acid biosynthesis glycosyltransferase WcaI n=1 Tax=Roseateles depolymerans TaxID=76731 RepID=A0A2W5DX03_9BURK|nr:MAG: colanic acid biosynthesis glycosyltransferase WcaI [Roseateles depolymerans]